ATRIFEASTIDFAQEMIRDTREYSPETVGELLAFLRKYRLYFASAEGRPDDGDVYRTLFALLREQKARLGLPVLPPDLAPQPLTDNEKLQGTWVLLSLFREGKLTPASSEPAKRQLLIFDGDRYLRQGGQTVFQSGTFKLDPDKTPRVLDL